jgi:hypothetical protein
LYIPGPKPPFDVRDLVPGSELDNDHLQARYDTANRMILLIGDIPFQRFLTEKWESLLPQLENKVDSAIALDLIRERPDLPGLDVKSCFQTLQSQYSSLSWREYTATKYRRGDAGREKQLDPLYDVHVALWRQGIYLPNPMSCSTNNAQQSEAVETLLAVAGSRSYQAYYERLRQGATSDWSREEISAVKKAMKAGVLFDICPNDRCCFEGICDGPSFGKCCFDCGDEDDPCGEAAVPPPDVVQTV